jgi:rSAM/selenodomain-associated transferase 1
MAEATVCIFAKPPEAGKAKTRLAACVGEVAAAELAEAFLRDTLDALRRVAWAGRVIAASEPFVRDYLRQERLWIQPEGTLNLRIEAILRRALLETSVAFAIGADSPGLPIDRIEQARATLQTSDVVLGPSADGGFYLIGLKHCPEGLLNGIEWSRPSTLEQTIQCLSHQGLSVAVVQDWFDIDTVEDLVKLRALLENHLIECPYTQRALERIGRRPRSASSPQ